MKRALKYLKLPLPITDLACEIWKDVFVNNIYYKYQISNKGRIKYFSRAIPCLIKLSFNNKHKYQSITLYGYGCAPDLNIGVHRLVAIHFIDNPNNLPEVNHKNFDRTDNNDSNLEWVTKKGNAQHALLGGRRIFKTGADNKSSKIVLNLENGVYFDTLNDACKCHNLKYTTTQHRLKGRLLNNTPLRYAD